MSTAYAPEVVASAEHAMSDVAGRLIGSAGIARADGQWRAAAALLFAVVELVPNHPVPHFNDTNTPDGWRLDPERDVDRELHRLADALYRLADYALLEVDADPWAMRLLNAAGVLRECSDRETADVPADDNAESSRAIGYAHWLLLEATRAEDRGALPWAQRLRSAAHALRDGDDG